MTTNELEMSNPATKKSRAVIPISFVPAPTAVAMISTCVPVSAPMPWIRPML